MRVLAWITPGTWPAVVAAAARRPVSDDVVLVAVADPGEDLPPGALGGLLGRAHPRPDADAAELAAAAARAMLDDAVAALGRPCRADVLAGRIERVVTEAAEHADVLILARDGDHTRLGPHSIARHARFVIDHAPCTVELVWPDAVPGLDTIPAPPPPGPTGTPRVR